ncbi:MAG: hypothetical protein AAGU19_08070 [Prolixibacteraceae bacterium]
MGTILEALKGVTSYPVPRRVFNKIAVIRGLDLEAGATAAVLSSAAYSLAEADVLLWTSDAPDMTEAGTSFKLSDKQRAAMKAQANAVLSPSTVEVVTFGYKGENL